MCCGRSRMLWAKAMETPEDLYHPLRNLIPAVSV
jgi:hypothetical protein